MWKAIIVTSIVTTIVVGICAYLFLMNSFRGMIDGNAERLGTQFEVLSDRTVDVVFLGDSITQGGLWNELFPNVEILNRGIGGDTTQDVLDRIEQVYKAQPKKLFLMIGVNDLNRKLGPDVALDNYSKMFDLIDQNLPDTKVYVHSVLPVNDTWNFTDNTSIPTLNKALRGHSEQRGYTYIDLHPVFADANGDLKSELSNDGIHLLGAGYELWRNEIGVFLR